jgi:hypothetical protein
VGPVICAGDGVEMGLAAALEGEINGLPVGLSVVKRLALSPADPTAIELTAEDERPPAPRT